MTALSALSLPQTVIFEGDMSPEKMARLRKLGAEILFARRRNAEDTATLTETLIAENRHPDLVEFIGESVLIGSEKDAPPGTVRHLLKRVLPYSPWRATARVIIFHNAAGIKDEAETALLKTLEEPAADNYFFLSVQTAEALKETIRSRAVIAHLAPQLNAADLPADAWLRFYALTGGDDFLRQHGETAENLIAEARRQNDEFSYSEADFPALEQLFFLVPKQAFEKDTITAQSRAMKFMLMPFYAAMRDRAVEGRVAALSPVHIAHMPVTSAVRAAELMRNYMQNLDVRIFGNRPLNQNAVFYSFLFRFIELWSTRS